jgi:hypothetical protein
MSFDWMSFATGFLERTEEIQTQRREEAEQFEQEQRQAAERNAQTISRRRAIADQVTGYTNYLTQQGVGDEYIQAAISAGPESIVSLYERVQAAVQSNRGAPLGDDDVAALVNIPEGFTPLDMSMEDFINQTYGLGPRPTTTEERAPQQFSLWDRLAGRDQMARAEERLASTPGYEGMTIQEINRAAQRANYESLMPGTFMTFADTDRYDVTQSDFLREYELQSRAVEDSPGYNRLVEDLVGDELLAAERAFRADALNSFVAGYASRYGEDFIAAHEVTLRQSLGDAYVDSLREAYREQAEPTISTEELAAAGIGDGTTIEQPTVETTLTTDETPELSQEEIEQAVVERGGTAAEAAFLSNVQASTALYEYLQYMGAQVNMLDDETINDAIDAWAETVPDVDVPENRAFLIQEMRNALQQQ